ncbi:MAG TPA: hypothetical protein VJQ84_01310, partial [Solirubrobacterales bacterium]|nr:hypothetical protein [Solirubrobacterales bacterium]
PRRVRLGLAALLDWFGDHQLVARVMLVEMGKMGMDAGHRFEQTFRRFTDLLDADRDPAATVPDFPHLATIAGGAVFARVYEKVLVGDCASLPQLLPELTFELLLPYLGEEDAVIEREAARKEIAEEAVYP